MRRLLEAFGWQRMNETGSHVTFKKPGERPLVVVKAGGRKVRRVYLDVVLDRLGLGDEG